MQSNYCNSEEVRAHIILLRDGLEKIDTVFSKTRFVPDRCVKKFSRVSHIEDIQQIAYAAHVVAIQSFPVNSTVDFFAWASQTIRREIVDSIRKQKRYDSSSTHAKRAGITLLGTCEHPECAYMDSERLRHITLAVDSLGLKPKAILMERFGHNESNYLVGSYFKRQKLLDSTLQRMSQFSELREYL